MNPRIHLSNRPEFRRTFDELYEIHAAAVARHIRRLVREENIADDILQEVFIRAWAKRGEWPALKSPRSWLIRIAVNLSLNHLRASNRRREVSIANEDDVDEVTGYASKRALEDFTNPGPETQLIRNNEREMIRNLISNLPAEKRVVLEAIDQEDLTINETAERLGIPAGTVKSRLYYGRMAVSEAALALEKWRNHE